ncbi:MAG: DUF1844 domain-containing protein [Candidatus Omnitrophica bacterium]|nr:DUF1844 domain-containing protein [Candidatus Omnitrophota bacterium]
MSTDKSNSDVRPEPNFSIFISSLSMQALVFMGEIDNPMTHKKETNLEQAKYMVDTLAMVKDKTQGNLSGHEANLLDNVLYELRMKYTAKSGKL